MNAKRGFRQKRLFAKISVDRRRNKDLDSLKAMGGGRTLTNATEVAAYLQSTDVEDESEVEGL